MRVRIPTVSPDRKTRWQQGADGSWTMSLSWIKAGKMNRSQEPGHACAADARHEFYVMCTSEGAFRYFVWQKLCPRPLVAWGEKPTFEDASGADESVRSMVRPWVSLGARDNPAIGPVARRCCPRWKLSKQQVLRGYRPGKRFAIPVHGFQPAGPGFCRPVIRCPARA